MAESPLLYCTGSIVLLVFSFEHTIDRFSAEYIFTRHWPLPVFLCVCVKQSILV